jgi:hypothetical protein
VYTEAAYIKKSADLTKKQFNFLFVPFFGKLKLDRIKGCSGACNCAKIVVGRDLTFCKMYSKVGIQEVEKHVRERRSYILVMNYEITNFHIMDMIASSVN